MAMDFFRRPAIAGKNVSRLAFGTVRGSVRRNDADGSSVAPYFPGVNGKTLSVLTQSGTTHNVVIAGNTLQNVLNSLNAGLAGEATAFDADGTVGIRSTVAGGLGWVEITSNGTDAAPILGFNTAPGRIRSVGGDVVGTPEGHGRGVPFGVAFPSKGENLTADMVTRPLARLAGNLDVLYSDLLREDVFLKKIGTVGASIAIDSTHGYSALPSTARVFTGLGKLTSLSTKEDLIPYFVLVDQATGQQAVSRVVGVTKGAPGAFPPVDAVSWAATAGGNVLGLNLPKVSAIPIDSILNGNLLTCSTGTFVSSGVQAGDTVDIEGATNTDQWSNNGYKWIVETVVDDKNLIVRPMSVSELTLLGVTLTDGQPVLELNSDRAGGQVFGNVTVKPGTYWSQVGLVVTPPIPAGATYDVWAASPASLRGRLTGDIGTSLRPSMLSMVGDGDSTRDGIVTGFTATSNGVNTTIAPGLYRYKGKVYNFPGATVAPAALGADNINYGLFFDPSIQSIATALAGSARYTDTSQAQFFLCEAAAAGGGTTSSIIQLGSPQSQVGALLLTVGVGGKFPTLDAAIGYANSFSYGTTESGRASGSFTHAEIILLSDISLVSQPPVINAPGIRIKGINPSIRLNLGTGINLGFNSSGGDLYIDDLVVTGSSGGIPSFISWQQGGGNLSLRNITQVGSDTSKFTYVCIDNGSGGAANIYMNRVSFPYLYSGILKMMVSGGVFITESSFSPATTAAAQPVLFSDTNVSTWSCPSLKIDRSSITGWATTSNTQALFATSAVGSTTISILNSALSGAGNDAGILIDASVSTDLFINNCLVSIPGSILGANNYITNSHFTGNLLAGGKFQSNSVAGNFSTPSGSGTLNCVGNRFSGKVTIGSTTAVDCRFSANSVVDVFTSSSRMAITGCSFAAATVITNAQISGCYFSVVNSSNSLTTVIASGCYFVAGSAQTMTFLDSVFSGCQFLNVGMVGGVNNQFLNITGSRMTGGGLVLSHGVELSISNSILDSLTVSTAMTVRLSNTVLPYVEDVSHNPLSSFSYTGSGNGAAIYITGGTIGKATVTGNPIVRCVGADLFSMYLGVSGTGFTGTASFTECNMQDATFYGNGCTISCTGGQYGTGFLFGPTALGFNFSSSTDFVPANSVNKLILSNAILGNYAQITGCNAGIITNCSSPNFRISNSSNISVIGGRFVNTVSQGLGIQYHAVHLVGVTDCSFIGSVIETTYGYTDAALYIDNTSVRTKILSCEITKFYDTNLWPVGTYGAYGTDAANGGGGGTSVYGGNTTKLKTTPTTGSLGQPPTITGFSFFTPDYTAGAPTNFGGFKVSS